MKNAIYKGNPAKKSFKSWLIIMLKVFGLYSIIIMSKEVSSYFENITLELISSCLVVFIGAVLFFVITLGGVNQSIKFLKEFIF